METKNISIIGLHRTGASIALALKKSQLKFTLIGHDRNSNLVKQAADSGIVDKGEANLIRAASAADILVLAMPSVELEETLQAVGSELQDHTLVIDLTALKAPGVKMAEKFVSKGHYVGARPIFSAATFSSEKIGASEAHADLFVNSVFCIMPGVETDPQAVETAVNFGRLLGASPYFVDPLEYDALAQGVESMPGLTAAAIFAAVNKTSAWRDILRFADLPFATSTMPLGLGADELAHLVLNDKLASLRWLDALSAEINNIRRLVYDDNREILTALLDEMDVKRTAWLHDRMENDWLEVDESSMELPGIGQRLFGSLGSLGAKH